MKKFINLTPHPITLFVDGERVEIPSDGVLRVKEERKMIEDDPIALESVEYGNIVIGDQEFDNEHDLYGYLKEKYLSGKEKTRVYVIVSLPALMSLRAKGFAREYFPLHMVAPDTSRRAIRDEQGRIVGVRGFITL